jgi:hypothetical protein
MSDPKPFDWPPPDDPNIGYTVTRRPDGGMHYIFTKADRPTLLHWREFALRHLQTADHNTRNLYDLRQITKISDEARQLALEVANDPAARNVRTAVVIGDPRVGEALEEIMALSERGNLRLFTDPAEAEDWLAQPFSRLLKQPSHL